jgi:pyochelin biosynthesis protein PchG
VSTAPTAVVVGATFGAVYADALSGKGSPVELIGIVGAGGPRSRALATRLGLPLHTALDDVPPVDTAVVVVRSTVVGGTGSRISARFLERGSHVLQEQPVHGDELIDLSRIAARHGVGYGVNDFYSSVRPVRRFVAAARLLSARSPIRYAQARCAVQVSYPLFTLLAQVIPRLTPARVDRSPAPATPFATVRLTLDDVPIDLHIDNHLCADDPDNHLRLLHDMILGTDAGELVLTHTHGPTRWRPRWSGAGSTLTVSQPGGCETEPTVAEIRTELWPEAVRTAVATFVDTVHSKRNPLSQRVIRAAGLWSQVTATLGAPALFPAPRIPRIDGAELAPTDRFRRGYRISTTDVEGDSMD